MEWVALRRGDVLAEVATGAAFADWLGACAPTSPLAAIDPYRDLALDGPTAARWLDALRAVRAAAIAAARDDHEARSHLPREPAARERILATLIDQTLARAPHHPALADLIALFELAIAEGGSVRLVGD